MAGFPEACIEQSVEGEGRTGRVIEAGFPKATPGSDGAANRRLPAGGTGTALQGEAVAEATATLTVPVRIFFKPQPRYPEEALRRGVQGDVLLDVEFRYSGAVEVLGVRRGLGHGLNESAIEAARKMRFAPARRDGRPVDTPATLRICFQLLP
jgi:TonB family protein